MTRTRTGLLAILLALVPASGASAAELMETEASAPILEEFVLPGGGGTVPATGTQLSPQAAVNPANQAQRVVVASEYRNGFQPRTAAWRWDAGTSSWVRSFLPGVAENGRGSPDVTFSPGGQIWAAHVGETGGDPCAPASGLYLSTASYGGGWSSSLVLQNDLYDLHFDHVSITVDETTGGAVIAADAITHAGDCNTAPTGRRIVLTPPFSPGDTPVATLGVDGSSPAIVSLPALSGNPRLILTYVTPAGNVAVERCTLQAGVLWSCVPTAEFATGNPIALSNGGGSPIPIGPSPDIAKGPDGTLHLVYTVRDGSNTDVYYTVGNLDGTGWSAPQSVADPEAENADQFMGTVAVTPDLTGSGFPFSRGRVDIAFLDRRVDGVRYQPYATSYAVFDGDTAATRARNRALDDILHAAPVRADTGVPDVGSRLALVATGPEAGALTSVPALAWWPTTEGTGAGDLQNSKLNHGRASPTLVTTQVATPKNVPVAVADLYTTSDSDGDPVRVSLTAAPSHGQLSGLTYHPNPGFAGNDGVGVLADDGYGHTAAVHRPLLVTNTRPSIEGAGFDVPEGASVSYQLAASDPDLQESLSFHLVQVDPRLQNAVSLSPSGELTIAPALGTRSLATLYMRVQVRDSSPDFQGTNEASIAVKIAPRYRTVALGVTVKRSGTAVKFEPHVTDLDPEKAQSRATYRWDFGDGSTSTTEKPTHRYRKASRYTYRLAVTMHRPEGATAPVTFSNTIDIRPAAQSFLTVTHSVNRKRKQLVVRLKAKEAGTATILLRAGKRSAPMRTLKLARNKVRTVRVPLARLKNARTGDLVVDFQRGLASQPDPKPIKRKVRLR